MCCWKCKGWEIYFVFKNHYIIERKIIKMTLKLLRIQMTTIRISFEILKHSHKCWMRMVLILLSFYLGLSEWSLVGHLCFVSKLFHFLRINQDFFIIRGVIIDEMFCCIYIFHFHIIVLIFFKNIDNFQKTDNLI